MVYTGVYHNDKLPKATERLRAEKRGAREPLSGEAGSCGWGWACQIQLYTQYATRILQKVGFKVCENKKMGLVDYAELEGRVFETPKGTWRSTVLNEPGAPDSDLVCFRLGFIPGEDKEPARECRVYSSDVALHLDRESERTRLHQAVGAWLERNERSGELPFPAAQSEP